MPANVDIPPEDGAARSYSTIRYGDIEVCWLPELERDGRDGGRDFGQDYVPVVEHLFGSVDRVFELCAGAGCIGFSLLAHGLCNSLVLSDINPVAVEAARETVRRNGLEDRVAVHHSDGLAGVPEDERCDLFVANPPFFGEAKTPFLRDPWVTPDLHLRSLDPGLQLHQRLYREMPRFLNPGGSALIQGCSLANPPEALVPAIEAGGLDHIHTHWYTDTRFPFIYYMWSKRAAPNVLRARACPNSVRVELRDSSQKPLLLSSQAVHTLRLVNLTGRPVVARVDLEIGSGSSRGRPLVEIPPDDRLELPQMALPPAAHVVVRDESRDSILADLRFHRGEDRVRDTLAPSTRPAPDLPPNVDIDLAKGGLQSYWWARMEQHVRDRYAGVLLCKFPEDLRTYEHLLWVSAADTVIEIGTLQGGSALWFRDRLRALQSYGRIDRAPHVISIDIDQSAARSTLASANPAFGEEIELIEADVTDPVLPERIAALLRPGTRCFVVEDSAHVTKTTRAALEGFARFVPDEGFFVVEDGHVDIEEMRLPLDPDGKVELPRGVLPALDEWLRTPEGSRFTVRRDLELYGITCHPRGFLQRRPSGA